MHIGCSTKRTARPPHATTQSRKCVWQPRVYQQSQLKCAPELKAVSKCQQHARVCPTYISTHDRTAHGVDFRN
eukprot:3061055-Alexandrium_andersonii.AAC.1